MKSIGRQPMTVNSFIKRLQSLSDDKRKLPITTICPNGLRVEPQIKIHWKDNSMFTKDAEAEEIVISWE